MSKGVSLEEALRRISPPAEYAEYKRLEQLYHQCRRGDPDADKRFNDYYTLFASLKTALIRRLSSGTLVADGFSMPLTVRSKREPISADLWGVLECDVEGSCARYQTLAIHEIEVYQSKAGGFIDFGLPLGLWRSGLDTIPEPSSQTNEEPQPAEKLWHNEDYSNVFVGSNEFRFGDTAARLIAGAFAARDREDGWIDGRDLLEGAGSEMVAVSELLRRYKEPHWSILLESDRRGRYRIWPHLVA